MVPSLAQTMQLIRLAQVNLNMHETCHHPCRTHTIGTMCSGGEVLHFVLEAVQTALTRVGKHCFRQVFAAEASETKRAWIHQVVNAGNDKVENAGIDGVCVYKDVTSFPSGSPWCTTHMRHCKLQRVQGLVAGISCKDISSANSNKPQQR